MTNLMTNDSATSGYAPRWRCLPMLLAMSVGLLLGVGLAAALAPSASAPLMREFNGATLNGDALPMESLIDAEDLRPNPDWSPGEVVQRQMESLAASRTDAGAIRRCFALASPANRQITGPVDRFAAMVATPTYRALIDTQSYLVGKPIIKDRYAAVLVSLVTLDNRSYAFRFLLSRQTGEVAEAEANCWMTDGVTQVLPAPRRRTRRPSTAGPGV